MSAGPGERLSLAAVEHLAAQALAACGASPWQAAPLARAVALAEAQGISSHGLAYVPTYCEHLRCGKVIGTAMPKVEVAGSVVSVDAGHGFAHAAIAAGSEALVPLAHELGAAVMAVRQSYNCGVLGHHTQAMAERGLVALGFTNAPASIAPVGAIRPVLGTNPWSLAAPGADGVALVIDQSASVVAKSEVMKRALKGEPIPEGWAFDAQGHPTTDPAEGLKGTMAPAGGYKGVGAALLVELFAACLTGASLGVDAPPFSGPSGGPPSTGQFFLAVDPGATSGGAFGARFARLAQTFEASGTARLPGRRRIAAAALAAHAGVVVDTDLLARITALATPPS